MEESPLNRPEITEMLKACSGTREALDKLVPFVFNELHRMAHRHLNRERQDHRLQTTGLVHETYLRRILVNYAIERNRLKRGGPEENLPLDEALGVAGESGDVNLLELDEALNELAELDKLQVEIIELRYFSGLTIEETAEILNISPATVRRDWTMAKAWLCNKLGRDGQR